MREKRSQRLPNIPTKSDFQEVQNTLICLSLNKNDSFDTKKMNISKLFSSTSEIKESSSEQMSGFCY